MDILSIVLAGSTALGGGGTLFLWLETRTSRYRDQRSNELDVRIKTMLQPLQTDVTSLHTKLDADSEHSITVIRAAIHDALEPIRDQVVTLNTKVEPLWTALINMGINQTTVLHQPDPRRAEYDKLLEQLQDELRGGPLMTVEAYARLQHYLTLTKTWEPGDDIGFPVLPAEPTSAAILLAIMGLSRARRVHEQEQK